MADQAATSDVEHLVTLEQAGADWRRNRNFFFFEDPQNKRALRLRQRIERVVALLRRFQSSGRVFIERRGTLGENARLALVLEVPRLRSRSEWLFSAAELELIVSHPALASHPQAQPLAKALSEQARAATVVSATTIDHDSLSTDHD